MHHTAGLNGMLDEPMQRRLLGIGDTFHANAAGATTVFFCSDGYQCLVRRRAALKARLMATNEHLINFDPSR